MSLPKSFVKEMNRLGALGVPFFFLIDFEQQKPIIRVVADNPSDILFDFHEAGGRKNNHSIHLEPRPVDFSVYQQAFDQVKNQITLGDSYLVNLTCKTPILSNTGIRQIFNQSHARYKVWMKDTFVCFSPETFVKIQNGCIHSYPMKGTIDAAIPNAESILTSNIKEQAEHFTIVDLIRNDLSRVARTVTVDRFRYTEKINTPSGAILQQSSAISGNLDADWTSRLGDIFKTLLPAGSISGAPKRRTLEIIRDAEHRNRGYYTGIAGVFDGQAVDSAVLIRMITEEDNQLYYHSGGGITHQSDAKAEYQEMLQKIYVPVLRKHTYPEETTVSSVIS